MNIGGELTLATIVIVVTSPLWLRKIRFEDPLLRPIFRIYGLLLLLQILLEAFTSTPLEDKIKGVAITLNSLVTLSYFSFRFSEDLSLIKYYLLGTAIGFVIFPNILSEIEGTEFGYYKFTIVPIITNILISITLFVHGRYIKVLSPLVAFAGLLFMLTGARSSGLLLFLVGLLAYVILANRGFGIGNIYKILATVGVVLYAIYALIYVPMVMRGDLDNVGNSAQLKSVENPYNPLSLLLMGRTESFVSLVAFSQKPLPGWGYNAEDPDMKYTQLLYSIKGVDVPSHRTDTKIPVHSVIGAYALSYGVCGLLLILALLFDILSLGVRRLFDRSKYIIVLLYMILSILWNAPFSPAAHLKISIPMMFSVILAIGIGQRSSTLRNLSIIE